MRLRRTLVLVSILVLGVPILTLADGPYWTTTDPNASPTASGLSANDYRRVIMTYDADGNLVDEWKQALTEWAQPLGPTEPATVFRYNFQDKFTCVFTLYRGPNWVREDCYDGLPKTGIDLTPPIVVAGLLVLAAALFSAAWFLLRRQRGTAAA